MPEILLFVVAIVAGLGILGWSADLFVAGASGLARSFGVPPLIIGLTIVAFGTSAPEILVSTLAAWQGNSGIAIGNAVGSSIANIALVLGITALVVPLKVRSETLKRELPLMLLVILVVLAMILNGALSRFDAIVLLIGMVCMVAWTVHLGRNAPADDPLSAADMPDPMPGKHTRRLLIFGLLLLLGSSRLMVWGAVGLAEAFGISDLVIGLSIVAIGTSLPELAASIVAARKGEHDIAIGNVVGSNMFNLLAVLGIVGIIEPGKFDSAVLTRDFPMMIGLTIALYLMARGFRNPGFGRIMRWEGFVLVVIFIAYQAWIFLAGSPSGIA